jgi:FtsH-binding integral membrane protein
MTTKKRKSTGGRIGLFLFASPFALVGVGMLVLAVIPNLYDWVRMQSWVPVDAQLISANLIRHHGNKSTTYQVVAWYRYDYMGETYLGRRVGISEKSDNIGDWHERTYMRLLNTHPLQVWVNPNDPQEAIVDRDLRWAKLGFYMIFALVFGGVGIGLMWMALRKSPAIPDGVPLWLGNPDWVDNQIRSNAKAGMWVIWAFTALWNLISSPILFIFPGELTKGNHAILIALLFPLVGLGAIAYAIKRTLEWRRFGVTPLQLDPFPGSIGGDVGGSIRINHSLPHDAIAKVQLSCMYVYTRNSGNESETARNVEWQDQQEVRIEPDTNGSIIRFRLTTPDNLPDSEVKAMPYYEWVLQVSCALPGVDLDRGFVIPVFKTNISRQSTRLYKAAANLSSNVSVPPSIMQVSHTGNGLRLHFPLFHARVPGIALTAVGAVFIGFILLFTIGAARNQPPTFFYFVFGGIGSLAFLTGLYFLGNSLTVVANLMGIAVTRRILGLALNKRIPSANIRSIDVAKGVQTTQGIKSVAYYSVKAHTRDGKKITVAESLAGISAAEQVARQIKAACNLRS